MELVCNICCSSSINSVGNIEGYRKSSFFEIMECKSCGTRFSFPTEVDERVYEEIYKNVEVIPGYARYFRYAQQILLENDPLHYLINSEDCYWGIINTLLAENSEARSENIIWEIGSGQGYLTYALVNAGFNCVGLDISETAVASAKLRYGDFYFCEDAKTFFLRTNQRPSFIILSEVIEHMTNPADFVSELISYLRPGGSIIMTTPNKDIYPSQAIWDTDLPPVHLWWFTKKSLQVLGERLLCLVSFANLDGFYRNNLLFINTIDNDTYRKPVFDNEYCVINFSHKRNLKFFCKKTIKKLIPIKYFQKLQLKNALYHKLEKCSAEKPLSLCVIYTKI